MDKKSLSNDQRLKSIHQRKENQLKSKNYIQEALSQSNVNKKSSNHIKFDSSSDEESEVDGENNHQQAAPKTRGGDDILGFNDSGSDDDELVINEQYEGESGSKLLSMQSKIGTNDSRFKLDARFISEKDAKTEEEEEEEEPMEMEASEDKKRNLSVLNSVLFSQGISNLPKKRVLQFHDPSKKRYDPTNVEHKDMVVEGPKKKKKKKKVETPAPEVDKSRFYEADVGTLKNVFQKSNQDEDENKESKKESAPPVFSFLSQFGSNSDLEEEKEIKKETELPTRHKPVMTSSDDETSEEEEEVEEKEEKTKPVAMVTPTPRHSNNDIPPLPQEQQTPTTLFMTSSRDPRITSGPLKFCWNKSKDEIRADWEEMQDFLRTDYRRKHRMAKKVEKHQNKREKEQLIFGPGAVEIS